MENFPSVVIGPGASGRLLYAEKPSLFWVVMLNATPLPAPRLVKMKRNVLAYLGEGGIKTCDVLYVYAARKV
jgi:hypothetical protein